MDLCVACVTRISSFSTIYELKNDTSSPPSHSHPRPPLLVVRRQKGAHSPRKPRNQRPKSERCRDTTAPLVRKRCFWPAWWRHRRNTTIPHSSGQSSDGNFWIWGKGDGGRLGFGHENPAFVPTLNPNLDSVRCIALGGIHSVALTSFGQAFSWGYGGFGALGHCVYHRELLPRLVEGTWNGKINHIATSGTHTAAVTESGELYTWGRDEGDGRLGLGPGWGRNEGGGLSIPSKVKALPVPVATISCGGFCTMALTEDGQIWNWGANSNNELGRGDKVGGWKPKPIPSLEGVRIIQIATVDIILLLELMRGKFFHGALVDMASWATLQFKTKKQQQ
ncbi:hypothetical protein JCGZ_08297 [Jatropha curcas]|uniref:Uncharacterized protein n=1 Tax=Jatropha curcas TaxID=180498 RepID=A0A067KMI9_JATCU|nr:hypothetical protein JCGZ_08297 [Jatropha curcas]